MEKYEFTGTNELSEKAFKVYSNSDFTFWKKGETFYYGFSQNDTPNELGTLEDVENFLLQFVDDEE